MSIYVCLSTLVCLGFLMATPSKLSAIRNLTGSLILAIAFGWLLWPVSILAWYRGRRTYAGQ